MGNISGSSHVFRKAGGNDAVTIDSSGNVGIGCTPDAWSGYSVLQIGTAGSLSASEDTTFVGANAYSSASGWKYVTTDVASLYQQESGSHIWYGAASGSADAAISWSERMRIDSSGKVGINDTDPSQMLSVSGTGSVPPARFTATGNTNTLEVWGNATASTSTGILCNAGTNSNDYSAKFRNYAGSTIMEVRGDSLVDTFGGIRLQDSNILAFGQSSDIRAYYDGTDSLYITAVNGTANKIKTNANETYIMQANGNQLITAIANSEVIINNDSSASIDFRVESDNYTHALFVNSGNSRVGINDSAPDRELEVRGDDSSTTHTVGIKVKNTNITTNSIAGIVFENYDNNGAYIRSLRSGSTAGILTFGINDGGATAESNITEKLRISGFLVAPESGVNIGSIRNNSVTVSTSAVNVLNLGSVNSSGDKGKGRYLVTVCATGGTVGTAGSAIFGLSNSGAVYIYETVNANSVNFGTSGAYVTASVSGGSYSMHVNAIPLSVDN